LMSCVCLGYIRDSPDDKKRILQICEFYPK
jgi:hypothetical protein